MDIKPNSTTTRNGNTTKIVFHKPTVITAEDKKCEDVFPKDTCELLDKLRLPSRESGQQPTKSRPQEGPGQPKAGGAQHNLNRYSTADDVFSAISSQTF